MLTAGFSDRAREIQVICQRYLCVCPLFQGGHGQECTTYLSICSTICTNMFPCLCTLFQLISSNLRLQMWPIVSLATIGVGDFNWWGCSHFCCTVTRWPEHCLRLRGWKNPDVEYHDRRDSGRSIYWTHRLGQICGILTRWPAHCLRLR